jgi:hypothetical protein
MKNTTISVIDQPSEETLQKFELIKEDACFLTELIQQVVGKTITLVMSEKGDFAFVVDCNCPACVEYTSHSKPCVADNVLTAARLFMDDILSYSALKATPKTSQKPH